ncbi:hypothetical protein FRC11_014228, partial [Ceratobasidium sp. 423]
AKQKLREPEVYYRKRVTSLDMPRTPRTPPRPSMNIRRRAGSHMPTRPQGLVPGQRALQFSISPPAPSRHPAHPGGVMAFRDPVSPPLAFPQTLTPTPGQE